MAQGQTSNKWLHWDSNLRPWNQCLPTTYLPLESVIRSCVVGSLLLFNKFLPTLAWVSGRIGEYLDMIDVSFLSALKCLLSRDLVLYLENLPYKSAETVNSLKAFCPISRCLILTRPIGLQRTLFSSVLI